MRSHWLPKFIRATDDVFKQIPTVVRNIITAYVFGINFNIHGFTALQFTMTSLKSWIEVRCETHLGISESLESLMVHRYSIRTDNGMPVYPLLNKAIQCSYRKLFLWNGLWL